MTQSVNTSRPAIDRRNAASLRIRIASLSSSNVEAWYNADSDTWETVYNQFKLADEESYAEIAEETGLTKRAVQGRIGRIRQLMKRRLKNRILVVGQAPFSRKKTDLSSPTWMRFKELAFGAEVKDDYFFEIFDIINLNRVFNGRGCQRHVFDEGEGILCASMLCMNMPSTSVVLLGERVVKCFRRVLSAAAPDNVHYAWVKKREYTLHVIPDLSPLNSFWSLASNRESAAALIHTLVTGVGVT